MNNQRENLAAFFEYNNSGPRLASKEKASCGHFEVPSLMVNGNCRKCALLAFGDNEKAPPISDYMSQAGKDSMANAYSEKEKAIEAHKEQEKAKQEAKSSGQAAEASTNAEKAADAGESGNEGKEDEANSKSEDKDKNEEDSFVPYSVYTPKIKAIEDSLGRDAAAISAANAEIKRAHERMDNGQKEIELAKCAFDSHTGILRMHASRIESLEYIAAGREAEMIAIAKQYGGKGGTKTLKIKVGDAKAIAIDGKHHKQFDLLLKTASARLSDGHRLNVWLKGPAGTGKTTAARNVATALNLPFAFNGALDSEYKLKGFIDAAGRIVASPFRNAWTNGGVYLFDEVDASLPSAVLAFNAALANGSCDFPDANVPRHADCVVIAAANTFGNGATTEYVGRAKQDAAFLDRFVAIDWCIDEDLETALCPSSAWCSYVQTIRAAVLRQAIKGVIVSPRASLFGAALLASGIGVKDVIGMTVRKGMTDDQWKSVSGSVPTPSALDIGL